MCQIPAPAATAPNPTPPPSQINRRSAPVVSPQIAGNGRVTFRIFAPQAGSVAVADDIGQGIVRETTAASAGAPLASGISMQKGSDGVWSGTSALPMKAGAWRYHFVVDGIRVLDSRNVTVSHYQAQMENLLIIPGDFSETRSVPHGSVLQVHYVASTLANSSREMYVYTPPGYEVGKGTYPVLYHDPWRR